MIGCVYGVRRRPWQLLAATAALASGCGGAAAAAQRSATGRSTRRRAAGVRSAPWRVARRARPHAFRRRGASTCPRGSAGGGRPTLRRHADARRSGQVRAGRARRPGGGGARGQLSPPMARAELSQDPNGLRSHGQMATPRTPRAISRSTSSSRGGCWTGETVTKPKWPSQPRPSGHPTLLPAAQPPACDGDATGGRSGERFRSPSGTPRSPRTSSARARRRTLAGP
jgi:hypothetical protein